MSKSVKITGINYEIDEATYKYVTKKVGRLNRYLTSHARKSVFAEVKLEQVNHDHGNKYEVEIIMKIPGETITASDSTSNMLAAFDIVQTKIISQLRSYKQTKIKHIANRGIMGRFKRSFKREL
jgi:putative sigma-54 modulation protein